MPVQTIRLNYEPRLWQSRVHHDLKGKHYGLAICSRQVGKTWLACNVLIQRTLQGPENSSSVYLSPAQSQARRILWPVMKNMLGDLLPHCNVSETQLMVEFPGGRRIYALGAESGDNIRGSSFRTIICDERDSISDEFWRTVMIPTTNAWGRQAFTLFIGTLAGGDSPLYRMYLQHRDDPDWMCTIVSAEDSGCFTKQWLDRQLVLMGRSAYERELACNPNAPVENAVLGEEIAEAERQGRVTGVPYHYGTPVHTAWDLGVRDFTAVWGYTLEGGQVKVLFYHECSDKGVMEVMQDLRMKYPRYEWGEAVLPHDANQRGKVSTYSVRNAFEDHWSGWVFAYESAPNPVHTLNSSRIILPSCVFDEVGCRQGLIRLKSARYVLQPKTGVVTDTILHDHNSHGLDAFRYGMHRLQTMYPAGGFKETEAPPMVESGI